MKYCFLLVLFLSVNVHAQKLEILLIGAAHNYGNSPQQDLSSIHGKIKRFKPTAFFGEFLSKEDERNLMDYWCKQDNIKRLERLRKSKDLTSVKLAETIDSLRTLVFLKPGDYRLKVELAHDYYLNQDVPNGHYLYWQVFSHLQKTPDAELDKYVSNLLSPESDVAGRSMKRLKTSEYALIAFPMMMEMQIGELHPMDCQDYDLNWSASALAFYNKFEIFRKDSTASYSNELKTAMAKRDQGFKKYAIVEKESKNVTEWLNTEEASAITSSGDFYFPEMYGMNKFPQEEMLSQIHWWLKRNRGMCENVVNRARSLRAEKVIVIVGANHRKYMQQIFGKMPDVTVRNINEGD